MDYDKKYFASGNYKDYLSRKFGILARDIISELVCNKDDLIIDFGCGYGGLLNELYQVGYKNIYGTDISNWAIEYGRASFPCIADRLMYYNRHLLFQPKSHVLFLDVLEHMPEYEARCCLDLAANNLSGFVIARIPVSAAEDEKYVLDVSNNDTTHINCHCREWWIRIFEEAGLKFVGDIKRKSIYSSDGVLSGKWKSKYDI